MNSNKTATGSPSKTLSGLLDQLPLPTGVSAPVLAQKRPRSKIEAEQWLLTMGHWQKELALLKAAYQEALGQVEQRYSESLHRCQQGVECLEAGLNPYLESHRKQLTGSPEGKKAQLANGEVAWRKSPPKVILTGELEALAQLKQHGLHHLIRQREEVDKQAVGKAAEQVKGLSAIQVVTLERVVVKAY